MEQLNVYVFGQLIAAQAEIEAMKLDNEIRKLQGLDTFNYTPENFFEKAQEVHNITNQLFR